MSSRLRHVWASTTSCPSRCRRWLLVLLAAMLLAWWSMVVDVGARWTPGTSSTTLTPLPVLLTRRHLVEEGGRHTPEPSIVVSAAGVTPATGSTYGMMPQPSNTFASHASHSVKAVAPLLFSAVAVSPPTATVGRHSSVTRFDAVSRSLSIRWRGTIRLDAPGPAAPGQATSIIVCLERDTLWTSPTRREAIDEDEVPWAPLAMSPSWAAHMRLVGPDAFYAVLVGPELMPMAASRRQRPPVRATARNDAVVSYELITSVSTAGTYVVHVQHQYYNFGGWHDRDRYAAPYEPQLVLGKRNAAGRAGSIKLSRQRLSMQSLEPGAASTGHHQFTMTVPRQENPGATFKEEEEDERAQKPVCTSAFVRALRRRGDEHHSLISGRYFQVQLPHEASYNATRQKRLREQFQSMHPSIHIRGWTTDTAYPINGRQYVWDCDSCRMESFLEVGQPELQLKPPFLQGPQGGRESMTAAGHGGEEEGSADGVRSPITKRQRGNGIDKYFTANDSKFAQCLSRRRLKVLFLGDSQVRTLFHTALSVVTLRKAVVGKTHYGQFIVAGRSNEAMGAAESVCWPPSWAETVDAAANCYRKRYFSDAVAGRRAAVVAGAEGYLEFIWDPLMLNLSSYSRLQARQRHRSSARDLQRAFLRRTVPKLSADVDDRAVRAARDLPSSPDDMTMEESEDADKTLSQLDDDYAQYGPDAQVSREGNSSESRPEGTRLIAEAVVQADVLVIGFGGWFGIHMWEMADVEAHLDDVVDALKVLGEQRAAAGLPQQSILLTATPAWPSYVTWEGHRRNTNYRLGAIAQLARRAFDAAGASDATSAAPLFELVASLPYFEMSYPVSHMRLHEKDIHYDGSMVPYAMMNLIASLMCSTEEQRRSSRT